MVVVVRARLVVVRAEMVGSLVRELTQLRVGSHYKRRIDDKESLPTKID